MPELKTPPENVAADASEGSDLQNSAAKNGAAENASGDFSENKGAYEASGENAGAENAAETRRQMHRKVPIFAQRC